MSPNKKAQLNGWAWNRNDELSDLSEPINRMVDCLLHLVLDNSRQKQACGDHSENGANDKHPKSVNKGW
jgi:hypothetical protein